MYLKDKAEGFVLMGGGGVSSLVNKAIFNGLFI
jgi:hypothetical protein